MIGISAEANFEVRTHLADAAVTLPADLTANWVQVQVDWIRNEQQLPFLLPEKLAAVVRHLTQGAEIDPALALAKALLAILPDSRFRSGTERQLAFVHPGGRFDASEYEEVLHSVAPELVRAAPDRAVALLCDLLADAVCLSYPENDPLSVEDFSYTWRPAIEPSEQNLLERINGVQDLLVSAVRDAVEQVASSDPSKIRALVEMLERRPWQVFQRIALHLLRVAPNPPMELIAARLTDREKFDEPGLRHEYALLIQQNFGRLREEDREIILGWISDGPDVDRTKSLLFERYGAPPAEDEVAVRVRRWKRDRLAIPGDALPPEWAEQYRALCDELGEPEHPDLPRCRRGICWVGPTSPKSADELRSMSLDDLGQFLRTWQWPREWMGPSPDGIGRELTKVVATDPLPYSENAARFTGLDPTYVQSLLLGFHEAIGKKSPIAWGPVLDLCQWVIEQPRQIAQREPSPEDDYDPDWGWTRREVAHLFATGFEASDEVVMIPYGLRDRAWGILRVLTDDPDPTPEHEARYGGSSTDPATLSINTCRGKAMHAVVRYGLWVRRAIEKEPNAGERLARGFDEMSEIGEVLDAHLDPARDPSLAVRAAYGWWFPWLFLLDRGWVEANASKVFPSAPELRSWCDAAWDAYMTFCPPYDDVFEILRGQYAAAIGGIRNEPRRQGAADPEERLAEHLMILYWRGKVPLDDPNGLLARFWQRAGATLRGHALDYVGRALGESDSQEVAPEIIGRLKPLWERRLREALSASSPAEYADELVSFGSWFVTDVFDEPWAIDQLTKVLQITRRTGPGRMVLKHLATRSATMPDRAVECLRLFVDAAETWQIYMSREQVREILANAIRAPDPDVKQSGIDLANRLGARGFFEFRDLLP